MEKKKEGKLYEELTDDIMDELSSNKGEDENEVQ